VGVASMDAAAARAGSTTSPATTRKRSPESSTCRARRPQRLVSLSVSEGPDQSPARPTRSDAAWSSPKSSGKRFSLDHAEVVPSDPGFRPRPLSAWRRPPQPPRSSGRLRSSKPVIMAIGTGRTLKARPSISCPRSTARSNQLVSLTGNIASDGSAWFYNVIFSMTETIKARMLPDAAAGDAFPRARSARLPAPSRHSVIPGKTLKSRQKEEESPTSPSSASATSGAERPALCRRLHHRGRAQGGCRRPGPWPRSSAGPCDAQGKLIDGLTNDGSRRSPWSAPMPSRERSLVVALAMGDRKLARHQCCPNRRLRQWPHYRRAHREQVARLQVTLTEIQRKANRFGICCEARASPISACDPPVDTG